MNAKQKNIGINMKKIVLTLLFTLGLIGNVAADSACCNENYGFYAGVTGGANWLNFKKQKIYSAPSTTTEIVITDAVVTTQTIGTTEVVVEPQPAEQSSEATEAVVVAATEEAAIEKAMAGEIDPGTTTVTAKRKNKLGWTIGGVAGYRFCPFDVAGCFAVAPRLEGEISYRNNSSSGGEFEISTDIATGVVTVKEKATIQTMAYMANCIVDMDFNFPVSPYIGGGIGYAHSWGKHSQHTESRFAYQGIAGFSFALCYQMELSVDYRYLVAIKDSNAQAVTVGLKKFF